MFTLKRDLFAKVKFPSQRCCKGRVIFVKATLALQTDPASR